MDKVGVIILHYNSEEDTRQCLNSLMHHRQDYNSLKLFVVTNQSSIKFISSLKKNYPKIDLIENKTNLGFAAGNNIGISKALGFGCEYILILNNDTIVTPDLVPKLILFAQQDSLIGLISPKIYFAPGFEYHKKLYSNQERGKVIWYAGGKIDWSNIYAYHRGVDEVDTGQFESSQETDFATGCCMLIKRSVIDKIGLLDKKYFLYYEDVDYSVRAKRAGFSVKYCAATYLWHKNASSSGRPGSKIHVYYQTRNRLYFGFKYAPFRVKKSLLVESLKSYFKGGIQVKSVKDYYLGKMGRASL